MKHFFFYFVLAFYLSPLNATVLQSANEGLKIQNLAPPESDGDGVSKNFLETSINNVVNLMTTALKDMNSSLSTRIASLEVQVASLKNPPVTFSTAAFGRLDNVTHILIYFADFDETRITLAIPKADYGTCITTAGCCDPQHKLCYGIKSGYGMIAAQPNVDRSIFTRMGCSLFSREEDNPFFNEGRLFATDVNNTLFGFTGKEPLFLLTSLRSTNEYADGTFPTVIFNSTGYFVLCFRNQ
eukprot:GCRY01001998.1.p1 GENE.GCRY01001998.1~~GCRY01001998.1.p1  ORF type:complete len:241 (-),score=36.17 GCRY01001998.1:292-1014(-)